MIRPKYSKEMLTDLYVNQQLGATTIARMLGYQTHKMVYVLLKHYQIPTRSQSQAALLREERKRGRERDAEPC